MGAEGTALLSTAHVALVVNTARATAGIAVQRMVLVGAVGQVEEKNAVLQDARIANRDVVTTAKCVGIPTLTTFPVTARMQGLVQVEVEGPPVLVEATNVVLQDAHIANLDVATIAKCVGIPTLTIFPVTARMQRLVQVEAEGPTGVSLARINLDPPCVATHRVMERTG